MLKYLVLLTVVIEVAALFLMKEREPLFYLYWIAITTFTNLLANLSISFFTFGSYLQYYLAVAVIELVVFTAEYLLALAYTTDKKKSLIYSAVCNISSYTIGSLILLFF
jgi:hypothetical protein